jgi:hypothetical protein
MTATAVEFDPFSDDFCNDPTECDGGAARPAASARSSTGSAPA